MTVQLNTLAAGRNKATLQQQLTTVPRTVVFHDPSIVNTRTFTGADIKVGEAFVVCLDPATRRRFANVKRTGDNTFKVS